MDCVDVGRGSDWRVEFDDGLGAAPTLAEILKGASAATSELDDEG